MTKFINIFHAQRKPVFIDSVATFLNHVQADNRVDGFDSVDMVWPLSGDIRKEPANHNRQSLIHAAVQINN